MTSADLNQQISKELHELRLTIVLRKEAGV